MYQVSSQLWILIMWRINSWFKVPRPAMLLHVFNDVMCRSLSGPPTNFADHYKCISWHFSHKIRYRWHRRGCINSFLTYLSETFSFLRTRHLKHEKSLAYSAEQDELHIIYQYLGWGGLDGHNICCLFVDIVGINTTCNKTFITSIV